MVWKNPGTVLPPEIITTIKMLVPSFIFTDLKVNCMPNHTLAIRVIFSALQNKGARLPLHRQFSLFKLIIEFAKTRTLSGAYLPLSQ